VIAQTVLAAGFIPGKPRPKGSLAPQVHRRGNGKMAVTLHDSPDSEAWKVTMIRWMSIVLPMQEPYAGPVAVEAVFYFARTIGASGEVWPSHDTPYPVSDDIGDTDKLQRNLGDALEQSGLIANDRNIVKWINPRKEWVPRVPVGASPGVWFEVVTL
jgi:Holliday junction resolvase RusA-like endonuclease